MVDEAKNEALKAEEEYRTTVEEAYDYVENFDILETITNVGNDEVFTPRKTADMMLDSLPEEVWHNPNYKWLNPATKNGIFEREIAIRLDRGLAEVMPDVEQRRKHILKNMIFAIGQTKFTANVARRTVYYCFEANRSCDGIKAPDGHYVNGYAIGNGTWFDDAEGNIKTPSTEHEFLDSSGKRMPQICPEEQKGKYRCRHCGIGAGSKYNDQNQRETYAYEFIHINHLLLKKHLQKRFFGGSKEMKFDIIIGNPPYQLSDGGNGASAMPIYQLFVEQAIALQPKYLSMIIPSRWYAGGRGLDDFRNRFLHDDRLREINDFPNANDCFPNNEIKGGVCYFLWKRDERGDCRVTSHRGDATNTVTRPLLEKGCETFIRYNEAISILHKVLNRKEKSFDSLVSANDPFGYDVREEGSYKRIKPAIELKPFSNSVRIYYYGWRKNGVGYTSRDSVRKNPNRIAEPKIFISRAYGAGEKFPHQILGVPFLSEPNSVCTETYLMIDGFKTENEAKNILSYIATKFFRFLVMLKKNTQGATPAVYEFVPIQDFSLAWTDQKLYEKYGFCSDEIAFIESMIKPMDLAQAGDDEDE